MDFEPDKITREHILKAAEIIESNEWEITSSTGYDVVINGKKFPPKEIMRFAHELATGKFIWNPGGGEPTNRYLKALGFEIENKSNSMNYYVLGAVWSDNQGSRDQSERFIENGIWENGWEDKFLDIVNGVTIGDRVAIKSSFATKDRRSILRVKAIGTVHDNVGNGRILKVNWDERFNPFDLQGFGGYRNTIQKVAEEDIGAIFNHSHISNSDEIIKHMTSKNIILYGPPGTGKTFNSIDKAIEIVASKDFDAKNHKANKVLFDEFRKTGQIEFVTFHQNYSYEDFMVGIRPDVEFEQLRFKSYKGIFYEIAKRARENYLASSKEQLKERDFQDVFYEIIKPIAEEGKPVEIKMASGISFTITDVTDYTIRFNKPNGNSLHTLSIQTLEEIVDGLREFTTGLGPYYNPLANLIKEMKKQGAVVNNEPRKNFVLIIDEINRANISKVFGELITLLEDDKRLGEDNELKISLPNGEKEFGIPPNLYVIGTMNTADKSIALIDIALRRRFEFIGFYPIYEGYGPDAGLLLKKINQAILKEKKSADYLIGHAYFMKEQPIETILRNKVIPLLVEYFSGKNDIVARIFTDTGWTVTYDIDNYTWSILKT